VMSLSRSRATYGIPPAPSLTSRRGATVSLRDDGESGSWPETLAHSQARRLAPVCDMLIGNLELDPSRRPCPRRRANVAAGPRIYLPTAPSRDDEGPCQPSGCRIPRCRTGNRGPAAASGSSVSRAGGFWRNVKGRATQRATNVARMLAFRASPTPRRTAVPIHYSTVARQELYRSQCN